MRITAAFAAIAALSLVGAVVGALPLSAAHGGGAAGGDTLARAPVLGAPPARLFEELESGAAHYYRLDLPEGARLRIVTPADAGPLSPVHVYVFGPDLRNDTLLPPDIEGPPGWGALVFPGNGTSEAIDARVPARFRVLAEPDVGPGERVLVLRTFQTEGARVGILAEVEGQVAWQDYALMPTLRGDVRSWAGMPAWAAWLVGGVGALVALVPFARSRGPGVAWPLLSILGAFAAATYGASTALLLVDGVRVGAWPWALLAAGALLAAASAWASRPRERPGWAQRFVLVACGIVGVATWSGFLWGPVAALAGALLPEPEKAT